jgi:hypothetical protein
MTRPLRCGTPTRPLAVLDPRDPELEVIPISRLFRGELGVGRTHGVVAREPWSA